MKEILMETISTLLPQIIIALAGLFGGVIAYYGNKIKKYYDEKYRDENIDKVLKTTVEYVEQVFIDIKGKEKLDKAKTVALSRLKSKGIEIDEEELTYLIEAFVRGLNNE